MRALLDRRFHLGQRGTSVGREGVAGLTAFMAAAYLIVVIPSLLASGGMDRGAATTAAIVVMAAGSLFMGLYSNLPFIVGPGLGGSAILGITLAQTEHIPWPAGLGIALLSGVLFLVMTLTGARTLVMRLVPAPIKLGLGASLGLFIALLGCRDAGMVALNTKSVALSLGDFSQPGPIVALIGLGVAVALQSRRLPGAMLAGIVAATLAGIPLGLTVLPSSLVALPRSFQPISFQVDIGSAFSLTALPYLFAFFAGEFFSTLGTTLAVGGKASLTDEHGNLPGIERPFLVDSVMATLGPLIGIPSGTALVESAAGVEAGGRTGLTSTSAALCFLATLLVTPLVMAVPRQATAPALILTGLSMFGTIRHLVADEIGDLLPALVMVLVTLVANNFGTGIAAGILAYVLVQILAGRLARVPAGLLILSVPLGYYFYVAATRH
ncbi:NCS2 family permease [Nitrospirillum sp. BR 11164]|uniref:NCS2 family permease n=1 Tax=Nitrospirillum sp. BR 11164 TaxID=3104324 RepID=UPI002AFDEFFF|nr:NCS2 family permease [Nitrospirillum sp. BR 11164]MEA1651110.1 NCS2 family permease [Nitrospirillum sp. BR 11164]